MRKLFFLLCVSTQIFSQEIYFRDFYKLADLRSAEELLYSRDYTNTNFWEEKKYWSNGIKMACEIDGLYELVKNEGYKGDINDFIDLLKNDPEAMKMALETARNNGFRGDWESLKANVLNLDNDISANIQNCDFDCIGRDNYASDECVSFIGFCEEIITATSNFAYEWDSSTKTAQTFITLRYEENSDNINCEKKYEFSSSRLMFWFSFVNEYDYNFLKREIQDKAKYTESIRENDRPSIPVYEFIIDSERKMEFYIKGEIDENFYEIQMNIYNNKNA